MLWSNGSPLSFKVNRSYLLTERKYGTTDFEMGESFSGLLVPIFVKEMPDLTPMFESFMDDLKKVVEEE